MIEYDNSDQDPDELAYSELGPAFHARFPHLSERGIKNLVLEEIYGPGPKMPLACPHGHGIQGVWFTYFRDENYWEAHDEELLYCAVCNADMEELEDGSE